MRNIIAEDQAKKEQSKRDTILLKPKNVDYFYLYICSKGETTQARPAKDISFVVEEGDDESNLNDDGHAEGEEEYDPNQENNSANGSMSEPDDE